MVPLQIDQLTKSFDGKPVLKGVDLCLEPGTALGLLGKNGSGKTTLLKCALGLLRPTSGTANIFGEEVWNLSAEAKSRLGYVPQEVVTYPWMRLRQVIAYTAAFYPTWNPALVEELCRRWELPLEDRAGTLSVGQLQSLGIVLALGHEPELLVLDEPVASLDPSARRQFLRTLIEILEETGDAPSAGSQRPENPEQPNEIAPCRKKRTVLFSTHITSDLERIASRVALLKSGRITFDGELDALKESVKRLRIRSNNGDLPTSFAVPGALSCRVEGPLATVVVQDFTPSLVQELHTTWNADVTVVDLNLEEIFLELHDDNQ